VTEKLTPAQARAIFRLWREKTVDLYGTDLDLTGDGLIDALDELTAEPRDRKFCQGCEYWGRGYASPTDKVPVWDCEHWDAREGFCPTERWREI